MLGLNTAVGNAAAGDFGLGRLPGRESEFQQAVDQALSYGSAIGASAVHCMAGVVTADDFEAAERTFVANLRAGGRQGGAGRHDIPAGADQPSRQAELFPVAASSRPPRSSGRCGRTNVKIMFDCYHTQIMQGDLTRRFETHPS